MKQGEAYQGFFPQTYGVPAVPAQAGSQPPHSASPPAISLRPLSTGEVLDRTFTLYRQRFWLFAGIGMLPAGVLLLSSAIRLLFVTVTHRTDLLQPGVVAQRQGANAIGSLLLMQLYFLPVAILFMVAYGVSYAATVAAVNRMGEGTHVSVEGVYRQVRGRWLRWCSIVLRQFWSAAWPVAPGMVVLFGMLGLIAARSGKANMLLAGGVSMLAVALVTAGVVFGVMNFIRYTLAVAAGVSEDLGVNASLRRSKALSDGRKGRLFLAWLLVYALQMVVAAVQMPLLFAAMSLRGGAFIAVQAVLMIVQFIAVTLVSPVASIAFTLFYIDERVRREGFDIEVLMRRALRPSSQSRAGESF